VYVFTYQFTGNAACDLSEVHDDRIYDENAQSKRHRRNFVTSMLGSGTQPQLETLQYQVDCLGLFLA